MILKHLLGTLLIAASFTATAFAQSADRTHWTGAYFGTNFGIGWGAEGTTTAAPANAATTAYWGPCSAAGACLFNRPGDTNAGVIGGLQLGYNIQVQRSLVLGVEADIQRAGITGTNTIAQANTGTGFVPFAGSNSSSLNWLGTLRARVGVLATPGLLIYATGGWAYGEVERSYGISFPSLAGQTATGTSRSWQNGWTLGGGMEYAVTPNATLSGEYLFATLSGSSYGATAGLIVPGGCTASNCNFNVRSGDLDTHIVRAKLNFRF